MDVKGAKALSERLAVAARNVDPPSAKAVGSEATDRGSEVADTAAIASNGSCTVLADARASGMDCESPDGFVTLTF